MVVCDPFRQGYKYFLNGIHFDKYQFLSNEYWFLGIGKSTPWKDSFDNNTDTSPPTNLDSVESKINFSRNMLAAKRIFPADVSMIVPRINWEANRVYTQYDDKVDLFDDVNPANFYVLVENRRVYKCIFNKNDSVSTVAPTHTDTAIREVADGYKWKFLFTLTEDNEENFLLDDFIPVEYLNDRPTNTTKLLQYNVQQAAVDGAIDHVEIESVGATFISGITAGVSSNVFTTDVTAGIGTTGIISSETSSIDATKIVDYSVKIDSGQGSGQQRRVIAASQVTPSSAVITVDRVFDVGLSSTDSKFSLVPTVVVRGDGSSRSNTLNSTNPHAEFSVLLSADNRIDKVEILDSGQNYNYAKLEVLPKDPFEDSSNQSASLRPVISPKGGHGSNVPEELGASKILLSKSFVSSESSNLDVSNDFRQFGLIRNPELNNRKFTLSLLEPTVSTDFVVGETAQQGFTTSAGVTQYNLVRGTVSSFVSSAVTGCSEVVVDSIAGLTAATAAGGGLTFQPLGILEANGGATATIIDVRENKIAGTEKSDLLILSLLPTGLSANFSTGSFITGSYIFGDGNTLTSTTFREPLSRSYALGKVDSWQVDPSLNSGDLRLKNVSGTYKIDENISEYNYDLTDKFINKARIQKISTGTIDSKVLYDQRRVLNITGDGSNLTINSFAADASLTFSDHTGLTLSILAEADIVEYNFTGGTLTLTNMFNNPVVDNFFKSSDSTPLNVKVTGVTHEQELRNVSRTVEYIQNVRPISRNLEQTEDTRIILGF